MGSPSPPCTPLLPPPALGRGGCCCSGRTNARCLSLGSACRFCGRHGPADAVCLGASEDSATHASACSLLVRRCAGLVSVACSLLVRRCAGLVSVRVHSSSGDAPDSCLFRGRREGHESCHLRLQDFSGPSARNQPAALRSDGAAPYRYASSAHCARSVALGRSGVFTRSASTRLHWFARSRDRFGASEILPPPMSRFVLKLRPSRFRMRLFWLLLLAGLACAAGRGPHAQARPFPRPRLVGLCGRAVQDESLSGRSGLSGAAVVGPYGPIPDLFESRASWGFAVA